MLGVTALFLFKPTRKASSVLRWACTSQRTSFGDWIGFFLRSEVKPIEIQKAGKVHLITVKWAGYCVENKWEMYLYVMQVEKALAS